MLRPFLASRFDASADVLLFGKASLAITVGSLPSWLHDVLLIMPYQLIIAFSVELYIFSSPWTSMADHVGIEYTPTEFGDVSPSFLQRNSFLIVIQSAL